MKSIYLIGSLRNEQVPIVAAALRSDGFDVFDDWFAAGPEADDWWRTYEKAKEVPYDVALNSYAAKHVFEFDKHHLDRCDIGVLLMPAGKSGHLELGYLCGQGKPCYILFQEEPERWDVMYQFATGGVHFSLSSLRESLKQTVIGGAKIQGTGNRDAYQRNWNLENFEKYYTNLQGM
jgi:hypothetical protein